MPADTVAPGVARSSGAMLLTTGLILGMRPANERRRHNVTPSLIGWAQN